MICVERGKELSSALPYICLSAVGYKLISVCQYFILNSKKYAWKQYN